MPTIFEQLCAVTKLKPRPGESYLSWAGRVTNKLNDCSDDDWARLKDPDHGDPAQVWHNDTITALDRRRAAKKQGLSDEDVESIKVPELESFVPVPASEGKPSSDSGGGAVSTDQKGSDRSEPSGGKEKSVVAKSKKSDSKKSEKETDGASKRGRGRPMTIDPSAVITVLSESNPKRAGTNAYKHFKLYKTGMTVREAVEKGIPLRDIHYNCDRKLISVAVG